jgi:hypothetical protein
VTPAGWSGPDLARSMHPVIVSLGLADQQEPDELDRAVRAHLDDPRTLVMPHLSFLVWGRKPPACGLRVRPG